MGEDAPAAAQQSAPTATACAICKLQQAKYTCPACETRTCSAACVKAHKAATGCTGKRDRTAYLPLEDMDERTLRSDYCLLEEAGRECLRARRLGRIVAPPARPVLPPALFALQRAARARGVDLCFVQPGMTRRRNNTTKLVHAAGRRRDGGRSRGARGGGGAGRGDGADESRIDWCVEWRFPDANGAVRVTDAAPENASIAELLSAHVSAGDAVTGATRRAVLRAYDGAPRQVRVLLEGYDAAAAAAATDGGGGGAQRLSAPVDERDALRTALRGLRVVEHPVLVVSLVAAGAAHAEADV